MTSDRQPGHLSATVRWFTTLSLKGAAVRDRMLAQFGIGVAALICLFVGLSVNIITDDSATKSSFTAALVAVVGASISAFSLFAVQKQNKRAVNETSQRVNEAVAKARISAFLAFADKRDDAYVSWDELTVTLHHGANLDKMRSDIDSSINADLLESSTLISLLVRRPRCTVVIGAPGSGKTTLLYHLSSQVLQSKDAVGTSLIPLPLSCHTWSSDLSFETWISNEARSRFSVSYATIRSWTNRGLLFLLLDGLDEIRLDARMSFVTGLNSWLNCPVGTRIVAACRTESYVSFAKHIEHDQLAVLQPLSVPEMERQLATLPKLAQVDSIKAGLGEIISSLRATNLGEEWRTPKLLRILSETVTLGKRPPYDRLDENPQDPAALAVKVGDSLLANGKVDAAIEKYREAAEVHTSSWRDVAHVRIGVLLARAGDLKAARNAIHDSLTSDLQVSMSPPNQLLNDELTADEESVLNVLNINFTLDDAQVGSKALLSPQRCSAALRSLRDRGLVEVVEGPRDSRRFRRTLVDLQSQE